MLVPLTGDKKAERSAIFVMKMSKSLFIDKFRLLNSLFVIVFLVD